MQSYGLTKATVNTLVSISTCTYNDAYVYTCCVQATHDEAIQSRVHLKLMSESEQQSQVLEEFKLRREKERTKLSEWA